MIAIPETAPPIRGLARRIGVTETALRKAEAKGRSTREPDGQWDVEKTRRRMIETADPVRSPLAGAVGAGTTQAGLSGGQYHSRPTIMRRAASNIRSIASFSSPALAVS